MEIIKVKTRQFIDTKSADRMILMRVLNEGQSDVFHILCFSTDCLFRQIELNQMYKENGVEPQ